MLKTNREAKIQITRRARFRARLRGRVLLVSILFIITALVFAFQAHLTPTGLFTPEQPVQDTRTDEKFSTAENADAISSGLSAESMMDIEEMLARLQLNPGTVDGVIDQETTAAISVYQHVVGLSITGVPSLELIESLQQTIKKLEGSHLD